MGQTEGIAVPSFLQSMNVDEINSNEEQKLYSEIQAERNERMPTIQTALGALIENPSSANYLEQCTPEKSPRFSFALNSICRDMSSLCGELGRAHPSNSSHPYRIRERQVQNYTPAHISAVYKPREKAEKTFDAVARVQQPGRDRCVGRPCTPLTSIDEHRSTSGFDLAGGLRSRLATDVARVTRQVLRWGDPGE